LEREVVSFVSRKWVTIKNREIFLDLEKSDSTAYFADRETAMTRMRSLSDGEWKINQEFDPITIESEFYV
jgi:hypothetical protein